MTTKQKETLQALVDSGQLTERAARRYVMPYEELRELLESAQRHDVADDLSRVLRALARARRGQA